MAPYILEIKNGFIFGLTLSILVAAVIAAGYVINPAIWLSQYPKEIREKFGPVDNKVRKQSRAFALLFAVLLVGLLGFSVIRLWQLRSGSITFLSVFTSTFTLLTVFNLFDLLVLDWLIIVTIRPERIILPGTEGMDGYGDYLIPLRGFVTGLIMALVAALLISGITVFLARVI